MKQAFLALVGGFIVLALLGGLVYLFVRAIMTLVEERLVARETKEIAAEAAQRRTERTKQNAQRLENGCEHLWGGILPAFPDDACQKCGLQKDPPSGPCDHVWRLKMDNVPHAECAECGQKYVTKQGLFQ